MPAVNVALMDGQLAWRQHDGGHTDGPNWKYFIPWADKMLAAKVAIPAAATAPRFANNVPADQPQSRTDQNSLLAHQQLLDKMKKGRIDVYFEGDSITRRWGATDYPDYLANWNQNFKGWNAADFGWGADRIQNILWRLDNGELDGLHPKVIVLLAGTNNIGGMIPAGREDAVVADVTKGIAAILDRFHEKAPKAVVVLTAIFPRNGAGANSLAVMPAINRINANLAKMADGKKVRFLNVNGKLADASGTLYPGMMNSDNLHPGLKGYEVWAAGLKPIFRDVLGAPKSTDQAPPPTGDPSAKKN
jgi:lysophospholipase L1-like esterase